MKVYLPRELDLRFRKAAMAVFGYGRGSLSEAAVEALGLWCAKKEGISGQTTTVEPEESTPKQNEPATVMRADTPSPAKEVAVR